MVQPPPALVHTEIDPAYEGRGLGTRLVGEALRDLRERGRNVIPICPLVTGYIRRHPEYADLVAENRDRCHRLLTTPSRKKEGSICGF